MKSIVYLITLFFIINSPRANAQYTKLFDFNPTESGSYPYYLALISDGTYLYGTTSNGGTNYDGTIFRIKKDGADFSVIHHFDEDLSGYSPKGSLLMVGENLYGTVESGGANDDGAIFRIKSDGTDFSTVINFDAAITGRTPKGSLFFDGQYLYGTNSSGGTFGSGTLFKALPDGSEISVLLHCSSDTTTGRSPHGHVISDGIYLYGMTVSGGESSQGVIYRIKPDGTGYQNILTFNDDPYGSIGYGGLVLDGNNYLYGLTNVGGEFNRGTIFKIKTDGSEYIKLHDFNNSDGAQPLGSLILVNSTLYGMTELSGSDAHGNVFSIETDGSNFTTLVDFDGSSGSLPFGSLLYEDGAFYGTTTYGGAHSGGVIFRYGDLVNATNSQDSKRSLLFPNPSSGLITVNSGNSSQLTITSTTGQILFQTKLTSPRSTLNLDQFPRGLYFVNIYGTEGIETLKLILN